MANQESSKITIRVPTGRKDALLKLAHELSTYDEKTSLSELGREAIDDLLRKYEADLPQEAKDDLDSDVLANGGGGVLEEVDA